MEQQQLVAFGRGGPASTQVGGRLAEVGGAYQLVSSHSHSIGKHRQTDPLERQMDRRGVSIWRFSLFTSAVAEEAVKEAEEAAAD